MLKMPKLITNVLGQIHPNLVHVRRKKDVGLCIHEL